MKDLFFELIQVAIGTRICLSHTPSADEWGELYVMAKKQSLVGVCFAGVQSLAINHKPSTINLPEVLYLQWMGMAAMIQQRNEVVNRQCVDFQKRLSADGFRSCIMKGQGVALYYNKAICNLRQSGDIDVWIDGDSKSVIEYVYRKTNHLDYDQKHIHYKVFEDTDVELHWQPVSLQSYFKNKYLNEYFDRMKATEFSFSRCDNAHFSFSTPSFNMVYLLLHIYNHYIYEGVGLRQLMDYYFVIVNGCEDYSSEETREVIRRIGLEKFAGAVIWVLSKVMGLGEKFFVWEPNVIEGTALLNEILQSGNMGKYGGELHMQDANAWQRLLLAYRRRVRMSAFDPLSPLWSFYNAVRIKLWKHRTSSNLAKISKDDDC